MGNGRPSRVRLALRAVVVIAATSAVVPNASLAASATGPLLTGPPSITGPTVVGGTLTATAPTTAPAAGGPAVVVSYAWQRCDAGRANCVAIPGATGATSTYLLKIADAGATIAVQVTATDGTAAHDSSGTSDAVGPVTSPPPAPVAPTIGPVTISGSAVVGETLTAAATVAGDPPIALTYQWQRCAAGGAGCQDIARATAAQYALVTADLGSTMRARMTASNGTPPDATGLSAPTAAVQAAADDAPTFDTSGSGTPSPGSTVTGGPAPSGAAPSIGGARVLTPFPVIRLRGRLISRGAYVTLFTVTAPVGARVAISCTGPACPRKRMSFLARYARTRVGAFQGPLRAGVRLAVRVSRPGFVGTITTFVIRAKAAPARKDACTAPASGQVIRCAA